AARAVPDAADAEPMLRVAEAVAFLADAVFEGYLDVLEGDLPGPVIDHEFLGAQQANAGGLHVDDEGGDAAMRALGAVGGGSQLCVMRLVRTSDESFRAVDDVVITAPHRGGAHAAGIAAGVGLGLSQAPVELAADGRQQILWFLRFIEVVEDGADVGAEWVNAARRQRNGTAEL